MTDCTTRTNRSKAAKMLLTTSPVNLQSPIVSSEMLSQTVDSQDENSNKFTTYLHSLAYNHETESDLIMKDHNYARAWNWKPESVFVRPAKKIFFSKPRSVVKKETDEIDIETVDEEPPVPPFDLSRCRQSMDEFQRVSDFIRNEDVEDWEDKIDKILWSPVQNRIFNIVMRILNQERIMRLTNEKTLHEPILRRTSIDSTAKKFRDALASAHWDLRITQWLHSLLFDHLPQDYLTIYLDILQSLRQKIPHIIDKMIIIPPNVNSKGHAVTWETLGPLLKKFWDPVSPMLNVYRPKKIPGNPVLVVIPHGMSTITSRQQKWLTQLRLLGMVETINTNMGANANKMTVLSSIEQIVQTARTKIQELKTEYPGRPVVLIGFNTGASIACQVSLSEIVSAIVCLGFPLSTVDGKRGSSDDLMLDLHCPVMFVIGENASLARIDDVEAMRERMLILTNLVVVGSADDQLRISVAKKITERITQSIVDRCILDEVADFITSVLTQPNPLTMPIRNSNSQSNCDNKNKRMTDSRKRKNSTSSCSLDSEPQSPCLKKVRAHSPMQSNTINNITSISASALPRGTLVTLTGSTATQTPKSRKARGNFPGFSDQGTPRLSSQNIDNPTGGITLNIGSLASLAPVGPIRFESTPISLQVSPAGTKVSGGTIKTSANTFIKVPKGSHQVNVASSPGQNVGKIKMLMPTLSKKTSSQRTPSNFKNVNNSEKTGDTNTVNIRTSGQVPVVGSTNIGNTSNLTPLPSIQTIKTATNVSNLASGKSTTNVAFTPKNPTTVTSGTLTSLTTSKATDNNSAGATGCKRPAVALGGPAAKARPAQSNRPPKITSSAAFASSSSSSSLKSNLAAPAKQTPRYTPAAQSSKAQTITTDKSAVKTNIESTDTSHQIKSLMSRTHRNSSNTTSATTTSLDDGLENILDIPIIIAKDGENLNNLGSLSPLPSSSSAALTVHRPDVRPSNLPPPLQVCSNKVFFINSRIQPTLIQPQASGSNRAAGVGISAQSQIKYTKIILTKRNDIEEKTSPVILTKNNGRANKLLLVEPKTDVRYIQGASRIAVDLLGDMPDIDKSSN